MVSEVLVKNIMHSAGPLIDISQAVVPKNKARGLRVKRKRIVKKFFRVPPVLEYNYKKFVPSLHASKA